MSFGAIASVVGIGTSLYGAAKSNSAQKKAAKQSAEAVKQSAEAAEKSQVDPAEIARVAREQAIANIRNSLALEQEFTPENAQLRQGAVRDLLSRLGTDATGDEAIDVVSQLLSQTPETDVNPRLEVRSNLLDRATQMAGEDLALGGQLPQDVRNEVARRSIANAGQVGGGQLGLSRFLTPRDLGLSSNAIRESRLNRASQLGQQEFANQATTRQQEFQNQQQNISNRMNATTLRSQLATLLSNLGGNQFQRSLSTASFGQTLQPPQSGLSPGDIASLYVQNASNAAQAGQNQAALTAQQGRNTAQTYGGIGGLVSGVDWNQIFNRGGATPPYVPTYTYGSTTPPTFGGGSIPGVNVPP